MTFNAGIEAAALKPCPFCGGEACYQDGYPYNIVKCISCGARSFTREDAIAAWNTRPSSSAPVEQREAVARMVDVLEQECWDLRCVSIQGMDDADIGWEVIEHHMAAPKERRIAFASSPIEALKLAISKNGGARG